MLNVLLTCTLYPNLKICIKTAEYYELSETGSPSYSIMPGKNFDYVHCGLHIRLEWGRTSHQLEHTEKALALFQNYSVDEPL